MKEKRYFSNTALAVILFAALAVCRILRTCIPFGVLPELDIPNLALISLVAVKKEHRNGNYGRRIVEAAAERLSPENRVFVICEEELVPFYKKCGFEKTAECYNKYESRTEE